MVFLLSISLAFAQNLEQSQKIRSTYDLSKLSQLSRDFSDQATTRKKLALDMAAKNGWEEFRLNADGSFDELMMISEDGQPLYYTIYNQDAARSTRANHLNIGGSLGLSLDGQGMTAHVWDGGPTRPSHQEFDGPGGNNRVVINDGVTALNGNSYHAQHVTGTIVASGVRADAKGMAPRARAKTHTWSRDLAEATSEAAQGMLLSNHSYGLRADQVPDYYFGAYIRDSRDWDNLMYNSPFYLMVVAAGNDGRDNQSNGAPLGGNSSYDKLTGHSTSKNNLVVANGQDASVRSDGSLVSVRISASSSEGPTDDLRIKPDITGNGTGVFSTYDNSNTAYNSISGTSMAAPNVTGTLLLLQQHYNNLNGNFMKAATLKGLALHTADDAGVAGPDPVYGWGLLNAKAAAEVISEKDATTIVDELSLSSGQTYTINVTSDGSSPLSAAISWTDPAGSINSGTTNLTTPVLVNDLDIRVTKGSTTSRPYLLTGVTTNGRGDNRVDPFERVDVSGASGTYTITVTHKNTLTSGRQAFSLIVTGLATTTPVCDAVIPDNVSSADVGFTSATISWTAVPEAAYDVRYRPLGATNWTTDAVTTTSLALSGLASGTTYEVQVRSKCPDGTTSSYSSSVTFTTNSTNCTGGIASFPYSESFENTLGAWSQDTGDDLNWTIQSGGTPSNGTGPSGANDGDFYLYLEVSGGGTGYPNKQAILNSPCVDLDRAVAASVTFDYQMTGNAVGTVALELSSDNGTSWTSVWSQSGNQGSAWSTADVDLSAYVGATILLRFNAVSGTSWQGDIAIDGFQIDAETATGCSGTVQLPYAEGFETSTGWTQVLEEDDGYWIRDANGTPSNNTGPSSAIEGSVYLYIEASSNGTNGEIGSNATAMLESGCFDLTGVSEAFFNLSYHMYGANMGSLTVRASTDDGGTWADMWTQSGNQGNEWKEASIDLDAYVGGGVQLRIVGTTGSGWSSDIAIDQLFISEGIVTTNEYEVSSEEIAELTTELFKADVYPNPVAGDFIQIRSNKDIPSYRIVDMMGQVILSGELAETSLDISHLSIGIYILELVSGKEKIQTRFMKQE
ncbi:MAG: S8 family serine peptidase [Bacteroidota bacterium]